MKYRNGHRVAFNVTVSEWLSDEDLQRIVQLNLTHNAVSILDKGFYVPKWVSQSGYTGDNIMRNCITIVFYGYAYKVNRLIKNNNLQKLIKWNQKTSRSHNRK